ncbi:MAG: Gx transporter family protein [Oscillospiraceae bacterium]|nr:Gx transporter family protein [Oscillospiraceae bacterium]
MKRSGKIEKLVSLGVLTAVSLVMFVIESQLPPITPFPGIKLGLANTVTLFILHRKAYKFADAVLVVIVRVLSAAFIVGNPSVLLFSLTGGISAVFAMLLFRMLLKGELIPVTSVAGALAHNMVQVAVAIFVSGAGVLPYIPVLILGGILSGLLTGFAVSIIIRRF